MQNGQSTTPDNKVTIVINKEWCKRCGICSAVCPPAVYDTDDFGLPFPANPEKCTGCMICVLLCPDFAVDILKGQHQNMGKPR